MKRMIFHIPIKIDPNRHSASHIRPVKMLQAFKNIGYEVDVVMGNGKERKNAVKQIKKNIEEGIIYEFIYSESSTMPTLLTESHHLPIHPFLDFDFFSYCKKRGIKIGLFYRDIFWRFPEHYTDWKSRVSKLFYLYDLKKYRELVDVLFLPSKEMSKFIQLSGLPPIFELPSGADIKIKKKCESITPYLEFFYVGGIGPLYNLTMFVKILKDFHNIHFTICCRKEEWNLVKDRYIPLLSDNVTVVHDSGEGLNEYYDKSDLCVLFVEPRKYWEFAMPYKLFEFIGRGKPIFASKGTETARFIEKNNCGITVEYDEEALRFILSSLSLDKLKTVKENVISIAPSNSWEARAKTVAQILKRDI